MIQRMAERMPKANNMLLILSAAHKGGVVNTRVFIKEQATAADMVPTGCPGLLASTYVRAADGTIFTIAGGNERR